MATDDSYEIMPYKEIVELKKQIGELQKKTGDTSSKELLNSMASLTKSMNNMLQLFSSAAEEMKLEEKTEGELSQKIGPLMDKVAGLENQNKTIAEGMVAIASMVKGIKGERPKEMHKPSPKPPGPSFGMPPLGEPGLPPMEPPKSPRPNFPPHPPIRIVTKKPMPPPGAMPPLGMPPPGMPPGPMPPPGAPMPPPDLGALPPLPPLEEEPKKKGIFKFFKKK